MRNLNEIQRHKIEIRAVTNQAGNEVSMRHRLRFDQVWRISTEKRNRKVAGVVADSGMWFKKLANRPLSPKGQ